jgi:O-antigen biosynthesis protein
LTSLKISRNKKMAGLLLQARSLPWRLVTHAGKVFIRWQDRRGGFNYAAWLRQRQPSAATLEAQRLRCASLVYQPQIRVILQGDDPTLAQDTLRSLEENTYSLWRACWQVSARAEPAARRLVGASPQVQLSVQAESVESLVLADGGDYILVLQAGDLLAPHAFYSFAAAVAENEPADIVYFDEDLRLRDGKGSCHPFLKPDWSPELLLSVNYLQRAFTRTALLQQEVRSSGSFKRAVCSLAMQSTGIVHLAGILCHALEDPAQPSPDGEHLQYMGECLAKVAGAPVSARVEVGQARYTWPLEQKSVSIIIPTRNKAGYLRACIASLFGETSYKNFEVIVIDNGSSQADALELLDELRRKPRVSVIENPGPFNFSAFNNQAAQKASGDVLLFLNNDIELIEPDWLEEMLRWALLPQIGVVGAKLLYPDRTIQHAGVVMGMEGHASHVFYGQAEGASGPFGSVEWYRNLSAVTGACMMLRREVFENLGGFDEHYMLAFSDIELCLRSLAAGLRVMYTPFARLVHHEGRTRARHIPPADIHRAYEQFRERISCGDPYYNPGLSYAVSTPTLRRAGEPDPLRRLEKIVFYTP